MAEPSQGAGPFEQVRARFQAFVQSIPMQTFGLLSLCAGLAVLDILSLDLISQGLTLERSHRLEDAGPTGFATVAVLLVLSLFSPTHGIFLVLLSVYFGKDCLSQTEGESRVPAYFVPFILLRQLIINAVSLLLDHLWFSSFPSAWARMAVGGGFGGLFPLICCLEAEISGSDPTGRADISILPFTVPKRMKPLVYAFGFSIIGGGDIDLFVGAILGNCIVVLRGPLQRLLSRPRFTRAEPSTRQNVTPEESASLLNAQSVPQTGASAPVNEHERRALLLAATERRIADKLQES